jgi:hypothetical protein
MTDDEEEQLKKTGYIMSELAALGASVGGQDNDFCLIAAVARLMYITAPADDSAVVRAGRIFTAFPKLENTVAGIIEGLAESKKESK